MDCQTLSPYHWGFPTEKWQGVYMLALDLNDSGGKNRRDNHFYTANLIHSLVWEGELSYRCSRYCYWLRTVKVAYLYVVLVEQDNYFSWRILMLLFFKRKLQSRTQDCGSYSHAVSRQIPIPSVQPNDWFCFNFLSEDWFLWMKPFQIQESKQANILLQD